MDALLTYIIKVTALLSLVWIFYAMALHRHTFHTANRWFFILGLTLSLLLPCVSLPQFAAANPVIQQAAGRLNEWDIMALFDHIVQRPPAEVPTSISAAHLITLCLGGGVVLFLGLFCMRLISFFRITRHANQQTLSGANVFFLREKVKPFSLFGSIFLNPDMHSEAEITEIIAHEIFHIRQKHTFDIILAEVTVILFWFNPFAWLLRKAIRQNLEYLADRHVLNSGCDIQRYQYILVRTSIAGISGLSIAHNFTFSNLKKRIIMMNKKRTPHTAMVKYLLLIPLIAFAWIGVHAGEITRTLNEIKYMTDPDTIKTKSITVLSAGSHRKTDTINIDGKITVVRGKGVTIDKNNTRPLIVIDGNEADNVRSLNPDGIESITVLKDKTSIALYGEKGKDGVILITTKMASEKETGTATEMVTMRALALSQAESVRVKIQTTEQEIAQLEQQIEMLQRRLKQLQQQAKQQQEPIK